MTWVYGSNAGIRSAGLRGLEARLQRGHQILRRPGLDLRDGRQFLALDFRLDARHQPVSVAVPELRWVELGRERLDELEREADLRVGDHDGSGRGGGRRPLRFILVHEGREGPAPIKRTACDELLLL